ncbi:MAG TPA: NAD-dependent epimerase/dehydratase family protein [Thermoanaerobaculia bacterium]|nr:NAD-dependent epimerase/dehydratase family protein [Thermoanaerobaculia bacterium]
MRILITGGAGFVGSYLARAFRRSDPATRVVAFDNLRRRGSESNLPIFRGEGIEFVHGDVRNPSDVEDLPGDFDLVVDASAEPSVLAGLSDSPRYVLETNLHGTINCLELARRRGSAFLLLSTSRVYSIPELKRIRLKETDARFAIADEQDVRGVSSAGIAEGFPVDGPRSFYGASKLASEMVTREYVAAYGLKAIIDRCGVIAGPGQFGKVDQGVFTLWVMNHFFRRALRYTGFGGEGKQVRDLLHPADLFELVSRQLPEIERHSGEVFNVGGGPEISVSLRELTELCGELLGEVPIGSDPETSWVDVPLYVSDSARARQAFGWRPSRTVREIVTDIIEWVRSNESALRSLSPGA